MSPVATTGNPFRFEDVLVQGGAERFEQEVAGR